MIVFACDRCITFWHGNDAFVFGKLYSVDREWERICSYSSRILADLLLFLMTLAAAGKRRRRPLRDEAVVRGPVLTPLPYVGVCGVIGICKAEMCLRAVSSLCPVSFRSPAPLRLLPSAGLA